MKGARNIVSVIELKRLLYDLKEKGSGVCIRFRLIGEMWHQNFTRVVLVNDQKVLIFDESLNRTSVIHNIDAVVQFELDARFQNFEPHFHYEVKPEPEFKLK